MRKLRCLLPLSALLLGIPTTAEAAEATRVATSFEEDNRFDVHFGIAYNYNFSQEEYQTGIPIIPSLGMRGEF